MSDAAKTEKASPERRRKAREEGQFARSKDGTQVAAALAVLSTTIIFFEPAYGAVRTLFRACFSLHADLSYVLRESMFLIAMVAFIPASLGVLSALAVGFAQAGVKPDLGLIFPKASRLEPLSHLKNIFSLKSAVLETLLTLGRVGIVGTVTVLTLRESMPVLISLTHAAPEEGAKAALSVVASIAKKSAFVLFVLSLADYAKAKFQLESSLKMSKQELKDEHKRNEGDGKLKHKMIARGRERIRRSIKKHVKTADVILANPTHVSVALRYRPKEGAPIVVAKGYDEIALYIRECAREVGVPIVESPPLARALAKRVKVGRVVPRDLWSPVAEVLAFVYRLKRGLRGEARGSQDSR